MSARGALIRPTRAPARRRRGKPVLLVTLGSPLVPEAASVALDAATDAGSPLILANLTTIEPLSLSLLMGYDALPELTPDTTASLRGLAERARARGLEVEWLRIRSPRPVTAMLELIRERNPGLVVFGAERRRTPRRLYDKAMRSLREAVGTLVWLPEERRSA
jgi:nucleotide-binding universal stress UspA family protein